MDRGNHSPTAIELLRRAEQAMGAGRPRQSVQRILDQALQRAEKEPQVAAMAHRRYAETLLETSPWNASLHLRRALALGAQHDDAVHALMGLAQAMLGHFQMAAAAYRRAIAIAPRNPWYNHNLGHLLDVALGESTQGLVYLERAHRAEPEQHDVIASLAHCLGRLGQRERALGLARTLMRAAPTEDRRVLLQWLEAGAPDAADKAAPGLLSDLPASATASTESVAPAEQSSAPTENAVITALRATMSSSGRDVRDIERACALWRDYLRNGPTVLGRASTFAAAIEYALVRVDGAETPQREIAARHGISVSSLQNRYASLRHTLNLKRNDPRYSRVR